MALFARLFGKKQEKEPEKCSECTWPLLEGAVKWEIPEFDPSQIRLIIFRDNLHGRTPLFDSKSIRRIQEEEDKKQCRLRSKSCGESTLPKFQFSKPGSDTKMLGEMMFGSIAMSYHGSNIKVHSIRHPPQLMFTKILTGSTACYEQTRTSYDLDSFDSYSLQSSFGDVTTDSHIVCKERASSQPELARSVPMEIPSPLRQKDDTGLSTSQASSGSFTPLFPSSPSNAGSSINSASFKSFQRRWQRIRNTSLEYGVRNRLSDPDASSGPQSLPTPTCKKSYKLGIGILIRLSDECDQDKKKEFLDLFFSHITLIEKHTEKLAQAVMKAMNDKKTFIHMVMDSLDNFRDSIKDLFLTPRLTHPVWLNMMSAHTNRQTVCVQFMTEFSKLVMNHESKDNNFFISTLLTAVLTHHLAWVPTVTPSGVIPSRAYLDKHSAKWLDTLASTHPYNPLWAQLSDLYGAIGYPMKMARTVIVGKNQPLICTLLYILSYFIRCSEVYVKSLIQEPEFIDFEEVLTKEMSPIKESGAGEDPRDSGIGMDNAQTELSLKQKTESECKSASMSSVLETCADDKLEHSSESQLPSGEANATSGYSSVECRLSTSTVLPAKLENIQKVTRANPTLTEESPKKRSSMFYVRLPSNDEAIVTEMDEYFDGEAVAKTLALTSKKCKCGKLTCFKCACKLDSSESIGTKSDDAGFVSMESQSETSDVINDYKLSVTETRVLSPIHSPRAFSPALDNDDTFPDAETVDTQRRRHASGERSALSRQISQTGAPARCRSITPTELGRRRHISSSSMDSESQDPFLRLREVPLPGPEREHAMKEFPRNFGHSLMAGLSDHYLSDFVLHGTCDPQFYQKLEDDLHLSARVSVLDEPVSEASCVVGNVDEHRVYILASNQNDKLTNPTITSSQLVSNLVESVTHFWKLKMPPEFCLMHLEDRLQEIYFKSRMLAEYLRLQKQSNMKDLTDVLGVDCNDLPLLLSVASTHSPELSFAVS